MTKKRAFRHGDVWLFEIDEIPSNLKEDKTKTLALGEATGHHHKMLDGAIVMKGYNDDIYVDVQESIAKIIHQEHGEDIGDATYRFKDVPKGKYKAIIKRQYKYGEESKVLD